MQFGTQNSKSKLLQNIGSIQVTVCMILLNSGQRKIIPSFRAHYIFSTSLKIPGQMVNVKISDIIFIFFYYYFYLFLFFFFFFCFPMRKPQNKSKCNVIIWSQVSEVSARDGLDQPASPVVAGHRMESKGC